MAFLSKGIKQDLQHVAMELGVPDVENLKVPELKDAIIAAVKYEEEFVKGYLDTVIEERKRNKEDELRKQQMEFELEKIRLENERIVGTSNQNGSQPESNGKPRIKLNNIIQKFDPQTCDISLYLILFERQAKRAEIKKEFWVTHLIGLLPQEITEIIARESEEVTDDYEKVKEVLLRRYKFTPEKFRQLFVKHVKRADTTWRDFAYELKNYFSEWVRGLEVTTFDELCDLMITDQIKRKVPPEVKEHFFDEWSMFKSSEVISEKLDDYENIKMTFSRKPKESQYKESRNIPFGRPHFGNNGKEDRTFARSYPEQRDFGRGMATDRQTERFERKKAFICYECGESGHVRSCCPELLRRNGSKINEEKVSDAHVARNCNFIAFKKVKTKEVTINNQTILVLIDTGCSVCLLREDLYRQISDRPKLSNNSLVLSGIGSSKVYTKGSIEQEIELDGSKYSLTWHIVPTSQMDYQAVIGMDILDQARLNFDKNGVEFCKYETTNALFMQASQLSNKDEVELNHVHDTQIRAELKEVTSACKSEKNESVDVPMKVVLTDDTPIESEKSYLSRYLRNRKLDVKDEKSATKQNVLRKLTFRRNRNAPDIPDLKSNVFWWSGVGKEQGCKLGDIPEIRERIHKAKNIRPLYRVLFFQWPTNSQDIVGDILKFNGFQFDKSSYQYSKRQSLMKIMLDKTIYNICELLDIRKGDKLSCIKNTLDFLLNPSAKIDPSTDPRWQSTVPLKRIKIDDASFRQSSSNVQLRKGKCFSISKNPKEKDVKSNLVTPTRSTLSSGSVNHYIFNAASHYDRNDHVMRLNNHEINLRNKDCDVFRSHSFGQIQAENKRTYGRKRKRASKYKIGDLVAIQRTQFSTGLKSRFKYFGPYKITKINPRDSYEVEKVGDHPGPNKTTASANMMKYF